VLCIADFQVLTSVLASVLHKQYLSCTQLLLDVYQL